MPVRSLFVLFMLLRGSLLGAAGTPSVHLLPGPAAGLLQTLDPGEIRQFWVTTPGVEDPAVLWKLEGGGQMLPEPGRRSKIEYRSPRAGGKVVLTATAEADPAQSVTFTLTVNPNPAPKAPATVNLLPSLTYVAAERHQGNCSNCYAWAATAAIELELFRAYGIRDRLSIQYFNDIYQPRNGEPADPCVAHSFSAVLEQYSLTGRMVPWANPHAEFQDAIRWRAGVDPPREVIGLLPNYRVKSISSEQIETRLWSDEDVIEEMKHLLSQDKAIIANIRGHYVVLVGYHAEHADPGQHTWLILNSFGAPSHRPDGTYDMLMRPEDYDGKFINGDNKSVNAYEFNYISELVLDLKAPKSPPEAQVHPLNVTLGAGQPLQLVASMGGIPPVTYQWLKDGKALTELGVAGRKSVLALSSVGLADAGDYSVAVTKGTATTASNVSKVTVLAAGVPSLTVLPEDSTLGAGAFRTFRATVQGLADPRVHWTLSGGGQLLDPEANPVRYRAPATPGFATLQVQALAEPALTARVSLTVKSTDLNGDGSIDVLDLALLVRSYRATIGDPNYEEAADLNGDGVVDDEDAMAFLAQLDEQP